MTRISTAPDAKATGRVSRLANAGSSGRWTGTGGAPRSMRSVTRTTTLLVLSTLMLVPVLWAVSSSLKSQSELARRPPTLLPEDLAWSNYTDTLASFDFGHYLLNSVIVTVAATLLTLTINSMAAYALAKYNFRGRDAMFLLTLATIMIPLQVILLPAYQVISSLGMANSLWGMIIPPAATPTGVFLLRQYMLTIPDEAIEAARIDGAGEFTIFRRVVLPLCAPALAVLAILSVIWRWNDFLWPLMVAQDESLYTLPVALARLNGQEVIPFNAVLAMSVVSMIPVIVIFLFLQRHIMTGIANTGLK